MEFEVYKKKPIEVTAAVVNNINDLRKFLFDRNLGLKEGNGIYYVLDAQGCTIGSVSIGDYIIRGVDGSIYPCNPDTFNKVYEKVGKIEDNNEIVW